MGITIKQLAKHGGSITLSRGPNREVKVFIFWGKYQGVWKWRPGMGPKIVKDCPDGDKTLMVSSKTSVHTLRHLTMKRMAADPENVFKVCLSGDTKNTVWGLMYSFERGNDVQKFIGATKILAQELNKAWDKVPKPMAKLARRIIKDEWKTLMEAGSYLDKKLKLSDHSRKRMFPVLMMLNYIGPDFVERYKTDPRRFDLIIKWAWKNRRAHMLKHLTAKRLRDGMKKVFHKTHSQAIRLLMNEPLDVRGVGYVRFLAELHGLKQRHTEAELLFRLPGVNSYGATSGRARYPDALVKTTIDVGDLLLSKVSSNEPHPHPVLGFTPVNKEGQEILMHLADIKRMLGHPRPQEALDILIDELGRLRSPKTLKRLHDRLAIEERRLLEAEHRLMRERRAAHRAVAVAEQEKLKALGKEWKEIYDADHFPPPQGEDNEYFTYLENQDALLIEGALMKHCVAGYTHQVLSGRSLIYHYECDGEKATLQISRYGNVQQFLGIGNHPVSDQAQVHCKEFIEHNRKSWLSVDEEEAKEAAKELEQEDLAQHFVRPAVEPEGPIMFDIPF